MKKAKKSLSQNFIIDKNICKKIIDQTNIKNKIVIEIGPGLGFLTNLILENKPKKLYLIEKDNELFNQLYNNYKDNKKISLINLDILKFDLNNFKNVIIISNLPYNISTKVIFYLFTFYKNIDEMVLMVQKEVAIKFDYQIISMNKYKFYSKLFSNYQRCFEVSSKVFKPKPKVQSTVVKFKINKNNINIIKAKEFSDKIFKNKRKKISNKLKINKLAKNQLMEKRIDKLSIEELLYIYNLF